MSRDNYASKMYSPTRNIPAGKVAQAKAQLLEGGSSKKGIIEDLMENMERIQPGHRELIQKEKPIIAELISKLRNREHEREIEQNDFFTDSSMPGGSEMSISSFESTASMPDSQPPQYESPPKSPKRIRTKTPLEKCLAQPESRDKFREFIVSKGASEEIEFWEACDDCERKAHGCTALAKKIINQLMKEMKDSRGHPEQSHMELALNSAVVAVRYELMLHKEETRDNAMKIVNNFVRDNSPNRVNLTTEKRNALIHAVDSPVEQISDRELISSLVRAQREICELMERKYFAEFSGSASY